jgi:hypothetical protein
MVLRALLVACCAVAAFAWLLWRTSDRGAAPATPPGRVAVEDRRLAVVEEPPPPQHPASARARAVEELRAMSETFRNTTLLIAIRDGGFVCEDVIDAIQTAVDAAAWLARCRDLHAYQVGVDERGALYAEPVVEYFDQLAPQPVQGNGPGVSGPFEQLERGPRPPRR